jgi:hypothetical protein
MFRYIENVFDETILNRFYNKYFQILDSDLNSHDIWADSATKNKTLPECFTSNLTTQERYELIEYLYSTPTSPFHQDNRIRNCDVAIQKLLPNCSIPKHTDTCIGSMTVFMNKEYDTSNGGQFVWYDPEVEKVSYSVIPKWNCAVWSYNSGIEHEVTTVNQHNRITMQFFIWDNKKDAKVQVKS